MIIQLCPPPIHFRKIEMTTKNSGGFIRFPSPSGFPIGVANMGGLSQNMGGAWGELKMLPKNTYEGVHLIVKLPAINLQASKFTKNELLHTYFPRICARF